MLQHEYLLAKISFDTAENECSENWQNWQKLAIFGLIVKPDEVYEQPVGDNDHIFITGCKAPSLADLVGSTDKSLEQN